LDLTRKGDDMIKQIQITASSIDEIMDEMTRVADLIRKNTSKTGEYTLLVDYLDRLNARVELHVKAKEHKWKKEV